MNRKLLFILLFTVTLSEAQNRYVVRFTDKGNSPFSLSAPQSYLSQRAINRRITQGIAVDSSDLPVNSTYIQQVAAISGVTVLNHSKWFNSVTVELSSTSALTSITALPFVATQFNVGKIALPDAHSLRDKFSSEIAPADVKYLNALRTTAFNYGNALNQTTMINIQSLHNIGYSGEGMVIAVIDAGFQDANLMDCFDSLFNEGRVLATWDFVSNEQNVFDNNWHGAAVLSTMAANIPGDMVGTAPHAQYILLRSEDASSEYIIEEYNWASAAEYADSAGADVINSSLGYTEFDDPSQYHTYSDMNGNTCPSSIAADMAAAKGILVVNSAGNQGGTLWQYISAPSDGDSVLAVGAVDAFEQYASFSSIGPSSDNQIKPDVAAQGQGTAVYIPGISPSSQSNGTSFSSPVIAGAVACLIQRYPSKKNMDIIAAVRMSASQFSNPDQFLGYGIPDFGVASLVLGGYEPSLFNDGLEVIDFYPNPVRSGQPFTFMFFSRYKEELHIEIYDGLGRLVSGQVIQPESSVVPVDINTNIPSGIYFIRAFTEQKSVLRKLIVN